MAEYQIGMEITWSLNVVDRHAMSLSHIINKGFRTEMIKFPTLHKGKFVAWLNPSYSIKTCILNGHGKS